MQLETYINLLVNKNIIPGMSILAAREEHIVYKNHFGRKATFPHPIPLHDNTIYDVASLTKPLITGFLLLYLLQTKKIHLDSEVKSFFPQLPFGNGMTIRHLATHTAGLPDWFPFYLYQKENYLDIFSHLSLDSRPGATVTYSCPGYILLKYIIEKSSGSGFQPLAQEVIFKPLKLENTFLDVPEHLKPNTAPTENGTCFERTLAAEWVKKGKNQKDIDSRINLTQNFHWREQLIQGDTHDNNSYYHGGCAGNAGLFSTAFDIHRISLEFFPETASILTPTTLVHAWKNLTPFKQSHRTIGFKRNSSFITSGGHALSRRSIGHNGFTGTCFWLDPRHNATVVILTNRIHPQYTPFNFNKPRRKIHKFIGAML